jgi:hypothetical protein
VDFGNIGRLTPADYAGLDLTPVRELKRAHDGEKVRAKHEPQGGTVSREQTSLERQAQALERASKKLESAGQTVHQVEDLLHDTLTGFRANRAEHRHPTANERLLRSADQTAADIVGYARFDEETLFPPSTSPIKFEAKKAVTAYGSHAAAMRAGQDPPEVAAALGKTRERLRGEHGVLPTLGRLAETGAKDPDGTDRALSGLTLDLSQARRELAETRSGLMERREKALNDEGPGNTHIDVAS